MIVYSHYNRLGTIDKNTEAGIYGTIESAEKLFCSRRWFRWQSGEKYKKEKL